MSTEVSTSGAVPSSPSESRWPSAIAVARRDGALRSLPSGIISASHGSTIFRVLVPARARVASPARGRDDPPAGQRIGPAADDPITLIAVVTAANNVSLGFLLHFLLTAGSAIQGRVLLLPAAEIWWTNVIVFALWYWEFDGGRPPARLRDPKAPRDFTFIQMTDPAVAAPGWRPRLADECYVSFNNASAFSPTDTMPLSRKAKELMLAHSTISPVTLLLVAARAVNIL